MLSVGLNISLSVSLLHYYHLPCFHHFFSLFLVVGEKGMDKRRQENCIFLFTFLLSRASIQKEHTKSVCVSLFSSY